MELVFREDPYARACTAQVTGVGPDGIRLDRTVFYPTGGGQPGDTGMLRRADGSTVAIVNTVKDGSSTDVLHLPAEDATLPAVGETITAEIDWERRYRHMRMHTCLHLLCSVVAGGVTGGAIGDGKGRLDFDLPDQALDKDLITALINRLIEADHPVGVRFITEQELEENPTLVRTMSVKPPSGSGIIRVVEIADVDLQPCGGTHVRRTGEIGPVLVTKIESKGRRNRRINLAFAE